MNPEERLQKILQSNLVPHALLFSGPVGSGKKEAALQFAKQLLKTNKKMENHPDIHNYFPEGKVNLHPIESIRSLTHDVSLVPFEAPWKIFIIHDAEKMVPTSSNALLKTLEEPASQTVIILLTAHPERLLPTVISRCQVIDFPPRMKTPIDETVLAILAHQAPRDFSSFESDKPDTVFETILFWYRDRLLLEHNVSSDQLHFPDHIEQIATTPLIPLEVVEKQVSMARLAHARSTKLSTCLEVLFLAIG